METPTTNDSKNALTDYDLCLALAQVGVNSQMAAAWRAWKRRNKQSETISIFKIKRDDGTIADSKHGLQATCAPLQLNLNVPGGTLTQVGVTISLTSGTVVYYDEGNEEDGTTTIDDWQLTFLVDLQRHPVDLETLQQIDPDSADAANDVIRQQGLSESVFSIEYLFLDLTKVDMVMQAKLTTGTQQNVPPDALTKAQTSLQLLFSGQAGEYMLGTVVRRNTAQATPTFAMTDFVFNVHAAASTDADVSTLDYLGVFAGRPLPASDQTAQAKFTDGWMSQKLVDGTQGLYAGVLTISNGVFMDQYLMPMVQQQLGVAPTADGFARKFSHSDTPVRGQNTDIIRHEYDSSRGYEVDFTPQLGSSVLSITGNISSSFSYSEHTLGPGGTETSRFDAAGYKPITGTVTLTASGAGTAFKVTPTVEFTIGAFVTTQDDVKKFGKVEQAFSVMNEKLGVTGSSIQESFENFSKDMAYGLSRGVSNALNAINVQLNQHAFIPPGGGVFTYSNVHFSDQTADLVFDVLYQGV